MLLKELYNSKKYEKYSIISQDDEGLFDWLIDWLINLLIKKLIKRGTNKLID